MHLPALAHPELKKLLAAQLPADLSDWLDFVAIGALLAFVWDAPSIAFAALAVGMGAPYLIVGPFAGALVDRVPIRTVLIWSNLGRALVTLSFFFADGWPLLVALIALRSSVDSFFGPAKQAAIQALAPKDIRSAVNGLSHAINQTSKIVAPGLGGAFLIWFAPSWIFVINALVSAGAAMLCLRLAAISRLTGASKADQGGIMQGVTAGLVTVRGHATIRRVLLMMAAGFFAMFIYDTFVAPLTRSLGFAPQHLGYALAAIGLGGMAGSLVFTLIPDLRRPQIWIAAGTATGAILLAILGLAEVRDQTLPVVALAMMFLIIGFTSAVAIVPIRVILQNTVPDDQMGAVTALSEAANTTALLSAPFLGAFLANTYSVGVPFIVGAGVMLAVAAYALTLKTS